MKKTTQYVIVARADDTGSERIAAEHQWKGAADLQRGKLQAAANCAGAAITYRVSAVLAPKGHLA